MWQWRSDGAYTAVSRDGGETFERIALPGPNAHTKRVDTWYPLVQKYAAKHGVPEAWLLAVVYSESGGDPKAGNDLCCSGLTGLHRKVWGLTREQTYDPDTALDMGAKILGSAMRSQQHDLPRSAATYNHGHVAPSAASVWGMVENMPAVPWTGYIEKIVRTANWYQARLDAGDPITPRAPQPPDPPDPPEPPEPVTPTVPSTIGRALAAGACGLAVGVVTYHLIAWSDALQGRRRALR